jgi:hypothetical protein
MSTAAAPKVVSTDPSNENGYRAFKLGRFELSRDEYFVTIRWPAKGQTRSHQMSAEAFLRACMRDVAWNFFYGWVNFDHVIGTRNLYGQVDLYAGSFNGVMKEAGVDYTERFDADHIMATFKAILRDWVNEGFDPFAAPVETGTAFGTKQGENIEAIERTRLQTRRMPGLPGDSPLASLVKADVEQFLKKRTHGKYSAISLWFFRRKSPARKCLFVLKADCHRPPEKYSLLHEGQGEKGKGREKNFFLPSPLPPLPSIALVLGRYCREGLFMSQMFV